MPSRRFTRPARLWTMQRLRLQEASLSTYMALEKEARTTMPRPSILQPTSPWATPPAHPHGRGRLRTKRPTHRFPFDITSDIEWKPVCWTLRPQVSITPYRCLRAERPTHRSAFDTRSDIGVERQVGCFVLNCLLGLVDG